MQKFRQKIIFSICLACLPFIANAASYSGTVSINEKGKKGLASEYSDTIVYFVPDSPLETGGQTPLQDKEMVMEKKAFSPRVLPIQKGTTVSFPNFDPILHNAFSTSAKNKFDLGLYSGGDEKRQLFDKSGLVRIYCNVHHNMVAYVLVFDNPFYTKINTDGSFVLNNLPDNYSGSVFVWHPRSKVIKKHITAEEHQESESFQISLTKRKIPAHKNKLGKSYKRLKEKNY